MTHEGRMARGADNVKTGRFLDNADTLYFLENKSKEKSKPTKKGVKKVSDEDQRTVKPDSAESESEAEDKEEEKGAE